MIDTSLGCGVKCRVTLTERTSGKVSFVSKASAGAHLPHNNVKTEDIRECCGLLVRVDLRSPPELRPDLERAGRVREKTET